MLQEAPFPDALAALVEHLHYRDSVSSDEWTFHLSHTNRGQGSKGLTLEIRITTCNSYPPHERMTVLHLMPVPPAAYDTRSWRRWVFDQIGLVETHERMEGFVVVDEEGNETRPYAPSHGPGNDPYMVREVGTELDVRTSFRGEVNP